jgi:uncharacterized protein (DUF2236 family)
MLWVHATLVHASLSIYTSFVASLTQDERESHYNDMALVARIFGVAAEVRRAP